MTERVTNRSASKARDPEHEEELEHERDFLLRSLDDLDRELVAGNIDPDTYRVLHDDYTARAAAVIESLADGVTRDPPGAPSASRSMRVFAVGGIVVFAVLAAVLLAHTIGQRRAGGEITGDSAAGAGATTSTSPNRVLAAAKSAAAGAPKSYEAQIAYARVLLTAGAAPAAIQQYLVAANVDPRQPEPLAYAGYLEVLVSNADTDATSQKQLIDVARKNLQQAITIDPSYPDSYAFQGELLTQIDKQPCPGALAFERYLSLAPANHPYRAQVQTDLATGVKAGHCPSPTTTPTTKP